MKTLTRDQVNQLAYEIVNCAIEVHKTLGPGLLESIYEESMVLELVNRGFNVKRQYAVQFIIKIQKLNKISGWTFWLII